MPGANGLPFSRGLDAVNSKTHGFSEFRTKRSSLFTVRTNDCPNNSVPTVPGARRITLASQAKTAANSLLLRFAMWRSLERMIHSLDVASVIQGTSLSSGFESACG